jgi:4-amino-4-deoxy-L-arabinose transferase-like glycosyltransferase
MEWIMPKMNLKIGNRGTAIFLACLTAIILTITAPPIGLTWDEPVYISGAESYIGWFGVLVKNPALAIKPETIDMYWSVVHEHPPLDRIWSGLVWSVARHIFDDLTAHRLGNILMVAFLVALLYLMVAEVYGKAAGLFAAAALISMPRFFFHAHLAALDVPVAVGTFAVTFLFWKTIDRKGWGWGILWGVAWGLAVAIKLNGIFIPIALVIWFLVFRRKWSVVLRLFLMGVFAILTFFLVWPWLYNQTWERVIEYINFHLYHSPIGQWYFGQFYLPPPWHFVFVILWAVVPLTAMMMILMGIVRAGKGKQDKGFVWLLILSAFASLLPFIFGKILLYDNERLFMPVFPFLAALAGVGFGWVLVGIRKLMNRMKSPKLIVPASIVFAVVMLLPQSVTMASLYPHLLSYYSEGVGGLPGATKLGLETTYWCETYAAALPYINEHAKPGDRIWVSPWSHDVLIYYQMHGLLRSDVKILINVSGVQSVFGPDAPQPVYGTYQSAEWYIFQYRQTQYGEAGNNYPILTYIKKLAPPVYEVSFHGVPLMQLYER